MLFKLITHNPSPPAKLRPVARPGRNFQSSRYYHLKPHHLLASHYDTECESFFFNLLNGLKIPDYYYYLVLVLSSTPALPNCSRYYCIKTKFTCLKFPLKNLFAIMLWQLLKSNIVILYKSRQTLIYSQLVTCWFLDYTQKNPWSPTHPDWTQW